MKLPLSIFLLLSPVFIHAQLKIKQLNKASVPGEVKYSGIIKHAVTWTDSSGTHFVVASETGNVENRKQPENQDAELFAYHYSRTTAGFQLSWKLYDFIKDCPVDIKASFIKNTFAVTDLNQNGQAEVWLMYKTVCHGDVSPNDMKIVMYENDRKYAVRGRNKVSVSEKETIGGEFRFDAAFRNGPQAFRTYATKLWNRNIMETWD